jgi:hypothetical protein
MSYFSGATPPARAIQIVSAILASDKGALEEFPLRDSLP